MPPPVGCKGKGGAVMAGASGLLGAGFGGGGEGCAASEAAVGLDAGARLPAMRERICRVELRLTALAGRTASEFAA